MRGLWSGEVKRGPEGNEVEELLAKTELVLVMSVPRWVSKPPTTSPIKCHLPVVQFVGQVSRSMP
jgi:hypothetical protein